MNIIIYILYLQLCISLSFQECCNRKSFFSCYGKGSCNIFCCNCDNGCIETNPVPTNLIPTTQYSFTVEDLCNTPCNYADNELSLVTSWFWHYNNNTNTCSLKSHCHSPNTFETHELCKVICIEKRYKV